MKVVLAYVGRNNEDVVLLLMGISVVFSVAIEVWLIWHALTHQYGSFRIAVLKKDS